MSAATTTRSTEGRSGRRLQGWHVLLSFAGFFGAVLAVNATMIYSAISTYSGVVATEPYRKGLHYNERVRADELQHRLGWQDTITLDRTGRIDVKVTQSDGTMVFGLDVHVVIGRPSTNRDDVEGKLAEISGHYSTHVGALRPGSWIVAIEVRPSSADGKPLYRARRRLWLAP